MLPATTATSPPPETIYIICDTCVNRDLWNGNKVNIGGLRTRASVPLILAWLSETSTAATHSRGSAVAGLCMGSLSGVTVADYLGSLWLIIWGHCG